MLVPNVPPDWQFIALRGPDVKSHMLILSTEQSSGLCFKMHHHHMSIFSREQSSGSCWKRHRGCHCWAVSEQQPWRTRALSGKSSICCSSWQRESGGCWGCSRLCCRLLASYGDHQGRGREIFYLNCTSYLFKPGIIFSLHSIWHSVVLPHYWRCSNGVTKSEFKSMLRKKCIKKKKKPLDINDLKCLVFIYNLSSWSSWAEEVYIFTGIMSFEYRISN